MSERTLKFRTLILEAVSQQSQFLCAQVIYILPFSGALCPGTDFTFTALVYTVFFISPPFASSHLAPAYTLAPPKQ